MDLRILKRAVLVCVVSSVALPALGQTLNITGTISDPNGSQTFSVPVTASTAQTVTIGETAVGANGSDNNANLLFASKATLAQPATIQSISFYVAKVAGLLQLGVYDATGAAGAPGNQIAVTGTFTPVVGWNTQTVLVPGLIQPQAVYLAFLPSDSALASVYGADNGPTYGIGRSFNSNMPNSFGVPALTLNTGWSIYATLQVGIVPPPQTFTIATGVNPPGAGTVTITPGPPECNSTPTVFNPCGLPVLP